MPHLFEASVGGHDAAPNDPKFAAADLLAEQIVLRKLRLGVEPAQGDELSAVEEHEHARAEGLDHIGQPLHQVIAGVQQPVKKATVWTLDFGGHTVQALPSHELDRSPQQRGVIQFDIGIKEEHVGCGSAPRAVVSAHPGQSARDYFYCESIRKTARDFGRAITRSRISYVHLRSRNLRVVLPRQ